MSKNTAKIKAGIQVLADKPYEIISGTVVAGSVNTSEYTMSVLPTNGGEPIAEIMLSTITENNSGLVLIPKDGSNVVIGSVDGTGEWTLLKANELDKATITIGNVIYEIDAAQVNIQNGSSVLNIGSSMFKMHTASESLFGVLKDLITGITLLTVSTSAGNSTVPVNIATFNDLLTRLNNLLSA